ncbi:hypothetical protein [Hymenobacter sp. UYCo722]|uniref:WD40/YVTN/BNR-like repeat-containing protein n=1 Tax=Hymenobacter sp. UYCo722 TaxID=3156335 RepID=UPI003397514A
MRSLQITADGAIWANCFRPHGMGDFDSYVYTSTDAGQTWPQRLVGRGNFGPMPGRVASGTIAFDIWALDAGNAWMVTYDYATTQSQVLKTTTGPLGFDTPLALPTPKPIWYVRFFNATEGIALAAPDMATGSWGIYHTTDGGSTWAAKTVAGAMPANEGFMSCEVVGRSMWAVTNLGKLIFTNDGGQTWTVASPGIAKYRVVFRSATQGLAYGYEPGAPGAPLLVRRTTDGGQTWTPVAVTGLMRTTQVVAVVGKPGTYLSVGDYPQSGSALSKDDGLTWSSLESTYSHDAVATGPGNQAWATATDDAVTKTMMQLNASVLPTRASNPATRPGYPNPTPGVVTIEAAPYARQAIFFDVVGRVAGQQLLPTGATRLDLTVLVPAIYRVQLTGPGAAPVHFQVVRE